MFNFLLENWKIVVWIILWFYLGIYFTWKIMWYICNCSVKNFSDFKERLKKWRIEEKEKEAKK